MCSEILVPDKASPRRTGGRRHPSHRHQIHASPSRFSPASKCVPEAADRGGRSRPCSLWDELSFDSLAASDDLECSRHLGKRNAVGDERVAVQQPGRQHPDSSVQGVLQ